MPRPDRPTWSAPPGLLDRDGLIAAIDGWSASQPTSTTFAADAPSTALTIVVLRIDHLDVINRRLGRPTGDRVIAEISHRLLGQACPPDLIARLSASRFAIARPVPTRPAPARLAETQNPAAPLERHGEQVRAEMCIDGTPLRLTCSEVHVHLHGRAIDGARAVEDAEAAARRATARPGQPPQRVDIDHDIDPAPRRADAARLKAAIEAGHIVARYQPVVELQGMAVEGAEALVRWPGSGPDLTDPQDLLELARAIGVEDQITDLVLHQACRDFARGTPNRANWWVSVNISEHECADPTLADRVARALACSGLEPHRLVIEASERVVPNPGVVRCLQGIADLGVRLAIDDFGSGWSTLAQLRSLPIDIVKLDRSIVSGHGSTPAPTRLCTAALALGRALGLRTLAEGIETGEELLLLCIGDCDMGQGFWWTRPTTLDDLIQRFGPHQDDADPYRSMFTPTLVPDHRADEPRTDSR